MFQTYCKVIKYLQKIKKNYKDKVELINDESFNISYSMRALENQYEWEIDYRINKTENDKELKLKFSFEGDQPIV